MENMKKWLIASLVTMICLVIALTACLFWVRSLSERLTQREIEHQELFNSVVKLYDKLYILQADLDEMDQEVNSLLDEMEYIIVGPGTQPETVTYRFTLTPKELSEDTVLELTVGDTTVPMTREGNAFVGTADIPLFQENEDYPVLSVTTAGITRTDVLEDVDLWCAYHNWLPELFVNMSGSESSENADSTLFFDYGFRPVIGYTSDPVTFTKVTMTRTVNGEEVLCEDVTNRLRKDEIEDFTKFYTQFDMDETDRVVVVIRAEDSQGYIHELETRCQYEEDSGCIEAVTGMEQIYGSDGTPLYTTPFEDFT